MFTLMGVCIYSYIKAIEIFVLFCLLFRATPAAYGSSWARDLIGATALACATATAMPDP